MMAFKQGRGRQPQTGARTIPAPVGGLNDRDSIASMKETDAVIMENWWPEPSKVSVRKGYIDYATGMPGAVESLFEFDPIDGNEQVFAAAGGNLYNVTAPGAVAEPVVTGQTNNRWQAMPFTTAGGSFVTIFNGADKPLLYDGTTWQPLDDTSTPVSITGVDTARLIDGCVFKGRAYLVERNAMNLWYLPPASLGGAATAIDMGQIFQNGGQITTVKTWTIDAGAGQDDHLVVISSNGEVAVFSGFDPATVGSWQLVGVFYLGRPIGQRCAIKYAGDLLIICEDGAFPLGAGLLSSTIDRRAAITDKVQNGIRKASNSYKNTFGWQLTSAADHAAIILNVPTTPPMQYVQNTISGAWTTFTGMSANCWLYAKAGLMFGGDGVVCRAWFSDNDNGNPIEADCLQAFSHFGSMAKSKYFTMIRPYLSAAGQPSILYSLNGDYTATNPDGTLNTYPPDGMIWGSMVWGDMIWGGSMQPVQDWLTVGGIFKSAGLRLKILNNNVACEWSATDYIYSQAGLL